MIRHYKLGAIIAVAAMFSGQSAVNAATVYPEKGAVLVNTGEGYSRISGETFVGPGGQVMTKHGGSAAIAYGGGCVVHVRPGEVKLVEEIPPCGGAAASADGSPFLLAGAAGLIGVGIGIAVAPDGDKPASP